MFHPVRQNWSLVLWDTRKRSEERRVGKSVRNSVDLGGRRIIKKKKDLNQLPDHAAHVKDILLRRDVAVGAAVVFFFKQKTAYEIVPCDWSSDVCSSDVSGSTSTTIACTPFAVLPRSGPKYAVASSPGSVPGRTAPRSGFALSASAPRATPRPESPRRCTRPPSSTRSAGAAPSSRLASSSTFSRTATAAAWHALPATTAPRLAKVPVPQWNSRVSPVITCTSVTSTPRTSATICANTVKWPCPCVPTPVASRTRPLGSTVTRAPS